MASQGNESKKYKMNFFSYWLMCHLRSFINSLDDMLRTPFSSLLTFLVIGVAMALPASLYILLKNVQSMNQTWNGTPTISLYLKQETSTNEVRNLLLQLRQISGIEKIQYISPQEGLAEFEKTTQLGNILSELNKNPIPAVIVITPTVQESPEQLQKLVSLLKTQPHVDVAQLDIAWVKRIYYIIMLSERITYTLSFLLGVGVILIIGNTIRLATQSHQAEITVLKLVGATDGFIRRPLIYRGLLFGIAGGAIAWLLISVMIWWLEPPAQALANSYNSQLNLSSLTLTSGLGIIGTSAILGLTGAWIAVQRYLNAQESL